MTTPQAPRQRKWSFAKFQFPGSSSKSNKTDHSDLPPGLQKTKTMREQRQTAAQESSAPAPRNVSTTSLDPMDPSAPHDTLDELCSQSTIPNAYALLQTLPSAQPTTESGTDTLPPLPLDRNPTRAERRESKVASASARRASKAQEKQARRASEIAQHEADRARGDVLDWEWHNRKCGCERFEPRTGGGCAMARARVDGVGRAVAPLTL